MYESQTFLQFLLAFLSVFFLWFAVYIAVHLRMKKASQDISRDIQVSDAGLSTLIYDLDAKVTELTGELENYHEINRECLRLLVSELRKTEYREEGWRPSKNKDQMFEVALQDIREAEKKKRRPGRPPRTHIKSE